MSYMDTTSQKNVNFVSYINKVMGALTFDGCPV